MKVFLIFLLFINLVCFAKTKIEIIEIYDGDTILAKINKEKFSMRLIGVDCFETSPINRAYMQAYKNNIKIDEVLKQGNIAKEYLINLYKKHSKNIFMYFYGIDKYSRVLGVLYFGNLNVNHELINKNICQQYTYK